MAERRGQEDYLEVQSRKFYEFPAFHDVYSEFRALGIQKKQELPKYLARTLKFFIIRINQTLENDVQMQEEEFRDILDILSEEKGEITIPPALFRSLSQIDYIDFKILEQFLQFKTEKTLEGDLARRHLIGHVLNTKKLSVQNF